MLSTVDLQKLILEKRHEIEKEKIRLGIAEPTNKNKLQDLRNDAEQINTTEEVKGSEEAVPSLRDEVNKKGDKEANDKRNLYDFAENNIPPDLEKYIRTEHRTCCACGEPIADRFLLEVGGGAWHTGCLRCCVCAVQLDRHPSCFLRDSQVYCKQDYAKENHSWELYNQ